MGNPNLDMSLDQLIKKSRTKATGKQGGQAKKPAAGQKGQGKPGGQKQGQAQQQKPGSKAKAVQQQKQGQKQGGQQGQRQGQLQARGAGVQKAGARAGPVKVCAFLGYSGAF